MTALPFSRVYEIFNAPITDEAEEELKLIIDEYVFLDELTDSNKQTLLHKFALLENPINTERLISHFLSFDHYDIDQNTPLHLVKNPDFFNLLINSGASFIKINKKGQNAIEVLLENDRSTHFIYFIKFMSEWIIVNMKTILEKAIEYSAMKCIQQLVHFYPKPVKDEIESSPQYINNIIKTGSIELLEYILDNFVIPFSHVKFDPWPTPKQIDIIASHCSEQELQSIELKGIPDSPHKKHLVEIISDLPRWNSKKTCVVHTPLHVAAEREMPMVVQTAKFSYPDIYDCKGYTPLYISIISKSFATTIELLKKGAICTARCGNSTPLHAAAARDQEAIVEQMLSFSAAVNVTDSDGATPLLVALENKAEGTALFLLDNGATADVSRLDGRTSLHIAAQSTVSETLLRKLLEKGADPLALDKAGNLPLMDALRADYSCAGIILEAMGGTDLLDPSMFDSEGIWTNATTGKLLLNGLKEFTEKNVRQMLTYASKYCARQGFSTIILQLSPLLTDEERFGLLKTAIKANNNATAAFLAGAIPQLQQMADADGNTAMHFVAMSPSADEPIFRAVFQSLQQLMYQNKLGDNPIHTAIRAGNERIVDSFVNIDAISKDVVIEALSMQNSDGFTPLELALMRRTSRTARVLSAIAPHAIFSDEPTLKKLQQYFLKGLSGNSFGPGGTSLLSYVIQAAKGGPELAACVQLVLNHGGDPSVPDERGRLPAHFAAALGHTGIVELLLDAGGILADVKGFFDAFEQQPDDSIVELVHTNDMRAEGILNLARQEPLFEAKLRGCLDQANLILKMCPQAVDLLVHMRGIRWISDRLRDALLVASRRISPQTCIGRILHKCGIAAGRVAEYTRELNRLQSNPLTAQLMARVFTQRIAETATADGRVVESVLIGDALKSPLEHVGEFDPAISGLIRLTADSHADYEQLFAAIRAWKETSRAIQNELAVFESYKAVAKRKIAFGAMSGFRKFPHGRLVWSGDITVKKHTLGPSFKPIFKRTKDVFVMYIFTTDFWLGSVMPDKSVKIVFSFAAADVFVDFVSEKLTQVILPFGQLEINFVNGSSAAELKKALDGDEGGFEFPESAPRLVRVTFVREGKAMAEPQVMLLDCDSADSALSEFRKIASVKIRNFTKTEKPMLKVAPLGEDNTINFL